MIPRTRNFVLGALVAMAGVLMLGVGSVATSGGWAVARGGDVAAVWASTEPAEVVYRAEVPSAPDPRPARLSALREKVVLALGREVSTDTSVTDPAAPPLPEVPAPSAPSTTPARATVDTCTGYRQLAIAWNPQRITQDIREGVRVYAETGSDPAEEIVRAVVPLRTWPLSQPSCLPHDVVAIALDGSLIRNTETALYTVFGDETLIGYTIDGYPLYGVTERTELDTCGGAMMDGAYRYYLQAERAVMLACFVGVPVSLQ